MKVEVAILGSSSLLVLMVSGHKATVNLKGRSRTPALLHPVACVPVVSACLSQDDRDRDRAAVVGG